MFYTNKTVIFQQAFFFQKLARRKKKENNEFYFDSECKYTKLWCLQKNVVHNWTNPPKDTTTALCHLVAVTVCYLPGVWSRVLVCTVIIKPIDTMSKGHLDRPPHSQPAGADDLVFSACPRSTQADIGLGLLYELLTV